MTGGNTASNGGGIQILPAGANVTMTDVAIRGNTAGRGGGIDSRGTLTMRQSEISGNTGTQVGNAGTQDSGGGGLLVVAGTATLENVTVSGNTTAGLDGGGGIYVSCGPTTCFSPSVATLNLRYVTLANNTASSNSTSPAASGGGNLSNGGRNSGVSQGTVNIAATLIADGISNDPAPSAPDCRGTVTSTVGYNLIENTQDCNITGTTTGNITGQDPNLGPLQNNGGNTQTRALLRTPVISPAIDAIPAASCLTTTPTGPNVDQRGVSRPQDGNGTGTAGCDIGAYEAPTIPTATITIGDIALAEGNAGTTNFVFPVTVTNPNGLPISVNYATADGTAVGAAACAALIDYQTTANTLNIPANATSATITVPVCTDTLFEPDETFLVNLSAPTNAVIGDNQATGTITNDDGAPGFAVNDVTQNEGNNGTTNFVFTVTLTGSTSLTASVNFSTSDGTATGGATCGPNVDYVTTSGTLQFPLGTTSQQVTVPACGDGVAETNETFFVNLSGPTNGALADNQGIGTILNDDGSSISINDVTQNEGNSGITNFVFSVTVGNLGANPVTVQYSTSDGTATANIDYQPTSGTLTFNPGGPATQSFAVPVIGDLSPEANETFFVNLTNPANAAIADNQGVGTIVNDDQGSIVISDVSQGEGSGGTTNFVFTVTAANLGGVPITVTFATSNGTATAGSDYVATSGTLTFTPGGPTSLSITVPVLGDTDPEGNETFFVNLTGATGAAIGRSQAVGTIINDDTQVQTSEDDTDKPHKQTEEEQQQTQHTNTSNLDQYHTKGFVTEVVVSADGKSLIVTIGLSRGESLTVKVPCERVRCPDIQVGDYLSAHGEQGGSDVPAEKGWFIADSVTVQRNGRTVH